MDRHLPLNPSASSIYPLYQGWRLSVFSLIPSFFFLSILGPGDWPNLDRIFLVVSGWKSQTTKGGEVRFR